MKRVLIAGVGGVAVLLLFSPVILHEAAERGFVGPTKEAPPLVLFVGDIMLDRDTARHARRVGSRALFFAVEDIFARHNVVVGNLEGTITTNPSVSEADNTVLRFTFEPKFAKVLSDAGLTTASLANNHVLDFGEFGLDDTRHYLTEAGITVFGSPFNEQQLATKTTIRDKQICFVGYHELFARDPSKVVEKMQKIEPECDYTVLFAHWGEEYSHEPTASQQELAHLFVDSGADLVLGAHPHAVQPVEVYKNVAIFYSLGNFIFDQGWRADVKRGAMVSVEFDEKETKFTVIPVSTYLEATLAESAVSQAVLADLRLDSSTFVLER